MRTNITELVFILDRSGSMSGLESDTIGGFNALLEKQRKEEGDAIVTTVLFDDKYDLLHDRCNIRGVAPITDREYFVRGCTALLDAVGRTILKIENAQKHVLDMERPDRTLFVITTDGCENASREFDRPAVKRLIEQRKEAGWEFLFLGANIDAAEAASGIGIARDRSVNFHADGAGVSLNFEAVSDAASCMRRSVPIAANWKARIEEDFQSRKER